VKIHLRLAHGVAAFLACTLLPLAADSWTAYNDLADTDPDNSPANITSFGFGRNYDGDGVDGELLDFQTGDATGIRVEFFEQVSEGETINWAGDSAEFVAGTDASDTFDGILNLIGNLSYNDAPGWYFDTIIMGLDPSRIYTFAATANRNGGDSYGERVTNWKILEAEAYQYGSSPGAHKVGDDSVEFSTGNNVAGNVARWTKIQPSPDGRIVIRSTHGLGEANGGLPGAHAYKGYAGGVFLLALEEAEAAYQWIAYNDAVDLDPEATADKATNFGIGRGYDGLGQEGALVDYDTGEELGVTVTLSETISEGETISWASDAAEFIDGTDAATYFSGILQLAGNMSYNDAPGWYLDTTFSGLDPNEVYTYVGTANRNGGDSYGERVTNWSILDAPSVVFASSEGTHKVSDTAVEFSTGNNGNGFVARWTDIQPSAEGTFTIRTSHGIGEENGGLPGAHAYKGYAGAIFLLMEQSSASNQPATPAVEVFRLTPLSGSDSAHPNTPVQAILKHTRATVDPDSITLTVDGAAVTTNITASPEETRAFFPAETLYASGSTHDAVIRFRDLAEPPAEYEQAWSFTVEAYTDKDLFPVIGADLGQPLDILTERQAGFAVRLGSPDENAEVAVDSLESAESVWDSDFENLADTSDYNPSGYYIESGTLNYQTDGAARGNKAGEQFFPGVANGEAPAAVFAFEGRALWFLRPGFYSLNVTVDTEFEIYLGATGQEVKLPRTYPECNNCGGEDAAWVVNFIIEEAGLYPVRIVYFNNGGAGSLEILEVAPDGARHLINSGHPNAILSFVSPEFLTDPLQIIAIEENGDDWRLDFLSPDPVGLHEVQSSLTLLPDSWMIVPNVTIENMNDGLLQAILPGDATSNQFFRIALLPPPPVFFDDMESGIGEWSAGLREGAAATETLWELGTPETATGLIAGAYSGENSWATGLTAPYAPGALITLRSPLIDLTTTERPRLRFRYSVDTTEEVEGGRVNFLDESGDLLHASDFFFWGNSGGWQLFDSPIPVEARNQKVKIEFELLSDALGPNGEGWFIDDVSVGK
jgi:hypothetical protein